MINNDITSVDVVVVGSGLGGMIAAIRAHDLGLRTVMIEKSHYYGGTSAFSGGGIWIPNHFGIKDVPRADVLSYLRHITRGKADERKLEVFVDNAPAMVEYARSIGVGFSTAEGLPDYFSDVPGSGVGRQLNPDDFDGKLLGDEFFRMRMTYPGFLAFDRYTISMAGMLGLPNRAKGWIREGIRMVGGYWADVRWRLKTARDSRLSLGRAFVGALRKAMMDRDIPLLLNTRLVALEKSDGRVSGIRVNHNGNESVIAARAVILAAGGFDQNQEMRSKHHPVKTLTTSSLTPPGGNEGDAIRVGQDIGADIDNMENAWWSPTVRYPGANSTLPAGQTFFDRSKPGAICVNRLGKRFCNESISYDRFGYAMIEEQKKTGAGVPCWMIFDASFRHNFPVSNILPGWAASDKKLPPEYWDNVLYRAATVEELAKKVDIEPDALVETVRTFNGYAKTGKDLDFNRGETAYDKFFGDARSKPNPNLGPIEKGPFYAVKLELGDLGTKGGLKVDEHARVVDTAGKPIEGLYATGNTTGSLFVDTYPGPGGTLGPSMTFGYVSANHAASILTNH